MILISAIVNDEFPANFKVVKNVDVSTKVLNRCEVTSIYNLVQLINIFCTAALLLYKAVAKKIIIFQNFIIINVQSSKRFDPK